MLRNKRKKQSASLLVSKLLNDLTVSDDAEKAIEIDENNKEVPQLTRKNFKEWMACKNPRKGRGVAKTTLGKKKFDLPIDTRCLLTN